MEETAPMINRLAAFVLVFFALITAPVQRASAGGTWQCGCGFSSPAIQSFSFLNAGSGAMSCLYPSLPGGGSLISDAVESRLFGLKGMNFACTAPSSARVECSTLCTLYCPSGQTAVGGDCKGINLVGKSCQLAGNSGPGSGGGAQVATVTMAPVEILTGRKVLQVTDWSSDDNQIFHFTRYYSSQNLRTWGPESLVLGMSWRSNFDSRATYKLSLGVASLASAADGDTAHIALPDGGELSFKKNGSAWDPVAMTVSAGSILWVPRTDQNVTWAVGASDATLTLASGIKYTFDFAGLLKTIVFIDGYTQTFEYGSRKELDRVRDSKGRTIAFEYISTGNTQGFLKSITAPDGKVTKFTYVSRFLPDPALSVSASLTFKGEYALEKVIYPDATPLTDTDNPTLTYQYLNNFLFPSALTGVVDERGVQKLAVTYHPDGRVLTSSIPGSIGSSTFAYDDINKKVTVTNSLGRSTVYTYSQSTGGVRLITAVDGVATTNCLASNTAYANDTNGYVSQKTDAEARITKYTRDTRGLPATMIEGFGTASAVTTTYTWHATKPLIKSVAIPGRLTTMAYTTGTDLLQSIELKDTATLATRTTGFTYLTFTPVAPATLVATGTTLANVALTVTNGNGSSLTGWTQTGGASIFIDTASPCSVGDPCFASDSGLDSFAYRDVTIPTGNVAEVDAGRYAAKLSFKHYFYPFAEGIGAMRLIFMKTDGTILGALNMPPVLQTNTATRERTGPVPALTRKIRIQMMMGSSNVRLDTIALTLTANGSATTKPYLAMTNPAAETTGIAGWTQSTGTTLNDLLGPCDGSFFRCARPDPANGQDGRN
jgi:YD repeat-containing protein